MIFHENRDISRNFLPVNTSLFRCIINKYYSLSVSYGIFVSDLKNWHALWKADAIMEKYQLQFIIHVEGSKYREFMNLMEKQVKLTKPFGCTSRMISQSIEDNNVFDYTENWSDLDDLQLYLQSSDFKTLNGAIKLLTNIRHSHLQVCKELEEVKVLIS